MASIGFIDSKYISPDSELIEKLIAIGKSIVSGFFDLFKQWTKKLLTNKPIIEKISPYPWVGG